MKKAFFINGGAGRVLSALPALEYHIKNVDPTAIVVSEGWDEIYLSNPLVAANTYPVHTKGLLNTLKDREIISPEPYRLNAYFNQKVNLVQAFDMLINNPNDLTSIPEPKEFNFTIGKDDENYGKSAIADIKRMTGKDKVVVFQPFGQASKLLEDGSVMDLSGRSFEYENVIEMIRMLQSEYAVIMMSIFKPKMPNDVKAFTPDNTNLLQWMSIIKEADYFLGCDSVGQHMANAVGKPATVVIGSTFPENISYPNNHNFNIVDNGKGKRIYSPIRVTQDIAIERNNERLMEMTTEQVASIAVNIVEKIGKGNSTAPQQVEPPKENGCCGGGCGTSKPEFSEVAETTPEVVNSAPQKKPSIFDTNRA